MIINLLANNGYIVLNKTLMKKVGLHEAILLGELSSEYVYWNRKNELEDGYFYSTRENIEEQTMLSSHQQRIAMENLKKLDILKMKQIGMPLRSWYNINEQVLSQILLGNGLISSSEKIEHQDVKNFNIKSLNNSTSCCEKIEHHVVKKLHTNNNKNMIDRLFNYIIEKDKNLPKGFSIDVIEKAKVLLNKYEMLYPIEILDIFTPENLEKIKVMTYVITVLSKYNMPNVDKICNRDRLISIYDWCKEKQALYEDTECEINDFLSYYHKSVVNEILKQKKTNFVANKNNEGEDVNEEYEC